MSARLVEEVLSHAPAELTPAERLLLVVIADAVRSRDHMATGTRRVAMTHAELGKRSGLTDASVRKVLQRLAKPPKTQPGRMLLEVRVGIGTDRHGRPQWAVTGRKPMFAVPELPAPAGCECWICKRAAAAESEADEGAPGAPAWRPQVIDGEAV